MEENRVILTGYLVKDKAKTLDNGGTMFKGKLYFDPHLRGDSFNLTAWGDTAELISTVEARSNVTVVGHLSVSDYTTACLACGNNIKRNWVDITISSFRVLI